MIAHFGMNLSGASRKSDRRAWQGVYFRQTG